MTLVILVLAGVATFVALAVVGIESGLNGRRIVFRSWGDVVLTSITLTTALASGIGYLFRVPELQACASVALVGGGLGLLVVWKNSAVWSDCFFVIPAKVLLVVLAMGGSAFALLFAAGVFEKSRPLRERLLNAAMAAGSAGGALAAIVMMRRMIERARGM